MKAFKTQPWLYLDKRIWTEPLSLDKGLAKGGEIQESQVQVIDQPAT